MLSLIIPTYNSKKTICQCINSILDLRNIKYEIILVDDDSKDGTLNINNKYANKYANIMSLHQFHGGVSKARNLGIQYASGTWVSFIDSDDTINALHLEKIYRLYLNNDYNGMVVSNINVYGKKYGIQNNDRIGTTKDFVNDNYPMTDLIVKDNAGKIYNLNSIKKYNLRYIRDLNNGEDYVFTMNFLIHIHKPVIQTHISYYNYNVNVNSSVRHYDKKRLKNSLIMFNYIKKLYSYFHLSPKSLNWIKLGMAGDILLNYLKYSPSRHKINSLYLLRHKIYSYNLIPNNNFHYKHFKCLILRIFMSPSNKLLLFIFMKILIIKHLCSKIF